MFCACMREGREEGVGGLVGERADLGLNSACAGCVYWPRR